jgi:4'-phosphopantetheinyl transferase
MTPGTTSWKPGPAEPRLGDGALHVWRVDLTVVPAPLASLLSEEELARAAQMPSERGRELWSRSRGVLRTLLGRYLRTEAIAVGLRVDEHGKPTLSGEHAASPPLFFNLSHSQQLALYAFTATGPVGVDVEVARRADASPSPSTGSNRGGTDEPRRPPTDHVALARRAFGEEPARKLLALEPARREGEFLRLWTRHEAELKRRGTGIGGGFEHGAHRPGYAPSIVELDIGPHAAAALAHDPRVSELRLWEWPRGS